MNSLVGERSDAGQVLPFEQLERSAATGRHMTDLVGDAEVFGRRRGVTATDDGGGPSLGRGHDRLTDLTRPGGKHRKLEHPDRTVPNDGLGARDDLCEALA